VQESPDEGTPLGRGPVYRLLCCLAGIGAGFGANTVGGWVSVPIWLVAVFLFGAGRWTALFTGGWLWLIRQAELRSGERPR
jgi:hypothetical protein